MGATNANIITNVVAAAVTTITTVVDVVIVIVRLCFLHMHTHKKHNNIYIQYLLHFAHALIHTAATAAAAGYN